MTTNTDDQSALLQIRKRFLNDFEFWAAHCCKIRTKQGTIVPLILNRPQKRLLQVVIDQLRLTGKVRVVVLKARQQGFSTEIHALIYWWLSQHAACKALVMAHEAESTTALFDMYKRTHDNCPDMLRPSTKYSSRTELVFDKLDTGLRVATAGGRGVARGETLQAVHLSEVAFWPTAFAAQNFNGLIQAVPETDDTFVFLESTANGMTGKFREMWVGAQQGSNGYFPFFSAWNESEEYREQAPEDFVQTPDERDLAEKHDLDNDQLFWRRKKIAANGYDLFRQEYPLHPDEAFLTTGRPVFNSDYVNERLSKVQQPIKLMAVDNGGISENPRGELKVYYEFDEKETYCIGADVGMGVRNGDPSVAHILDTKKRQVAVWRGLVHPDYFATILNTLGLYYNTALICPERNNHGLLTCVKLRDLGYPHIYTEVAEGALDPRDTINIGLYVTERTKPMIIDELRAAERLKQIEINDETTLREMLSFVVTESGKMEAEAGQHDDCVMALALANHVHEGSWEPVSVTDEYYTKAI